MNKTLKIYGILLIVVIVLLWILQINKTEVTDWRKNFDVDKKSPFGLFVFNKEADELFNKKLKRTKDSPFKFYRQNKMQPHNILLINPEIDHSSWKKILKNAEEGSSVMVIGNDLPANIKDTLGTQIPYPDGYRDEKAFMGFTDIKLNKTHLVLDKKPSVAHIERLKKDIEILGFVKYRSDLYTETNQLVKDVNFVKIKFGRGQVYLHLEPLFMTNYYLLKPGGEKYLESVFSYLPNRETVWFAIQDDELTASETTPVAFLLSNPPLKYAWQLFLGGLLLFAFFNAKRKQRIVPVIEAPQNKSVEFVKSIGNLYLQEGDFHDMMAKKAQYFLHRVRMDLSIDTQKLDANFAKKLQAKTGKDLEIIDEGIVLIKKSQDPYAVVYQEDLLKMDRLLDEIL